jgi:hypothetical protein
MFRHFDPKEVGFAPLKIMNRDKQDLFLIQIKNIVECVDESKSIFKKFHKNHPVRPDMAGTYEYFEKLVIDKSKTKGHHIFRIKNYEIWVIVSEKIKNEFNRLNIQGAKFVEV